MSELILGIETSCDETAAAVVEDGQIVRSNVVHSQTDLHARWRGVVPEVASRSHTERILPIVDQALSEAGVGPGDLAAVAVTQRPGMIGCLLVGLAAAKALSFRFGLPIVGVDHVQAHVHTGFLAEPDMPLPALALVASGGHTAIWLVRGRGDTERLGTTRDDAAGEALDKGANLLGLPYPGGPAIERTAAGGDPRAFDLPRTLDGFGFLVPSSEAPRLLGVVYDSQLFAADEPRTRLSLKESAWIETKRSARPSRATSMRRRRPR